MAYNVNTATVKSKQLHLQRFFVPPPKIKNSFLHDSVRKNRYAANIVIPLIFIIELFNIARVLFFSPSGLTTRNNRIYFGMYCVLFLSGIVILVLQHLMKGREKKISCLYTTATFFFILWHVLLNYYDLKGDSASGTVVFMTAIFGISVFVQMKPISTLAIYIPAYLSFLLLTMSISTAGTIINISISVIVAIVILLIRYSHTITELMQQAKIETMNALLKKEQDELRLSLEKYEIIMEQSNEVIFEWDILNDCLLFSQNFIKEFRSLPIVNQVARWVVEDARIYEQDKQIVTHMWQKCLENKENGEAEFRIKNKTGEYAWYCARMFLQYDVSGNPIYGIGVITDIDKQKNQLEELTAQLQVDPLTGILNTLAFQNKLKEYASNVSDDRVLAMFMLDLDDFKSINDQYGHLCGDCVLKETAKAMQLVFRESDLLGRLGGDEFAVVLSNIKDISIISQKAERLLAEIANIKFEDKDISISCSIGIATANAEITNSQIYKRADDALYDAKYKGKGCYHLAESDIHDYEY